MVAASCFTMGSDAMDMSPESTTRPWTDAARDAARCTADSAPMDRPQATTLQPSAMPGTPPLTRKSRTASASPQRCVTPGDPVDQP